MLRMTIEGVGFDNKKQTVVVLKDWESRRLLPIWIGAAEARSIALHLEGAKPPRPMAHDLLMDCIQMGGGHVARVVINDLQDTTFYATIDIAMPGSPGEMLHVDSRPSDAIALAVRAKCPVFVDGGALEALIEVTEETVDEEGQSVIDATALNHQTSEVEEFDESSSLESAHPGNSASSAPAGDDEINRFKRLVGDLEL